MWQKISTIKRGRWWFFWNFVMLGRSLHFSVWADQPAKLNIDALNATMEVKDGS